MMFFCWNQADSVWLSDHVNSELFSARNNDLRRHSVDPFDRCLRQPVTRTISKIDPHAQAKADADSAPGEDMRKGVGSAAPAVNRRPRRPPK
jgi:hypothetical protein